MTNSIYSFRQKGNGDDFEKNWKCKLNGSLFTKYLILAYILFFKLIVIDVVAMRRARQHWSGPRPTTQV